jgi:hypothetical protein
MGSLEAGGGAGAAAMASSGEVRLGQTAGDVARQGETARLGGRAVALGGGGTWLAPEQRRDGRGGAHGRDNDGGTRQRKTEERGREVDEGGPGCNFQKR